MARLESLDSAKNPRCYGWHAVCCRASVPMPVRSFLALAAAAFFFFVPRLAFAQSIAIAQEQSLPRVDGTGNTVGKRATNLDPGSIDGWAVLGRILGKLGQHPAAIRA